jgi:hypothetical protein
MLSIKSRIPLLTLFALLLAASCGRMRSPTEPGAGTAVFLAEGHWSSTQMCLDVTASSIDIAAGCGRGSLPRPLVSDRGAFVADGTFTDSFGPPAQSNVPKAARFTGFVDGDTVTVTITSGTRTYPTWKATRGSTIPCLPPCP